MSAKTIYLTDIVFGHPDIKGLSNEIMFSVKDFYERPERANGYRKIFTDQHRLAEDSGGFQFLMGKLPLEKCDPMRTIDIYKRIGVTRKDFPIQLDLPLQYGLTKQERLFYIQKSAEFYHQMVEEIDWTIPVVHGWTYDELRLSLELIENSELCAVGSNYGVERGKQHVISHVVSRKKLAVGTNIPLIQNQAAGPVEMGKHGAIAAGANAITATTRLHFTGGREPQIVGVGSYKATTEGINIFDAKKPIAVGANQQSGRYVLDEAGTNKKMVAAPGGGAEEHVQKAPQKVVWDRLALVLNMFRERELFMLGAASPHDQHMIFLGGARYGDTSAWRIKGYLGEIYIPERGSVAIGHKGSPRPKEKDMDILRECLRDSTHPLCGMSLSRFLAIGYMKAHQWKATRKQYHWEIKPGDLRLLHNAWVLKQREEVIANEFATDPDRYYKYLKNHRFQGHRNLLRKLEFLWARFKRPYVQTEIDLFLK